MEDKPIIHIEWETTGSVQGDRKTEITEFAIGLLGPYHPNIWGALRPKASE